MKNDQSAKVQSLISDVRRYEGEKDYFMAIQACSDAAALNPEDPTLLLWLGWLYCNDKQYQKAIRCAQGVMLLHDNNESAALRLLIFSSARSGAWELAFTAFDVLGKISAEESSRLAEASVGSFCTYIASIHDAKKFADVVVLYESIPTEISNLKTDNALDIRLIASNAYVNLGEYGKAIYVTMSSEENIGKCNFQLGPTIPFAGVTLITSIMPTRHTIQTMAVRSWCNYGASVLSVNSADEIEILQDLYPDVKFVVASKDAREELGKPYVYLSEMMLALSQAETEIVGIINSDIVLRSTNEMFMKEIYCNACSSFVYGHRYDVKDIMSIVESEFSSEIFYGGIDWFMFPKKHASCFSKQSFIFGCPWWDLWLPIMASSAGLNICLADGPLAYHEEHAQRWNFDIFSTLGIEMIEELAVSKVSNTATLTARHMAEMARSCNTNMRHRLEDKRLVGRFADMIKSLLKIEARKITDRINAAQT